MICRKIFVSLTLLLMLILGETVFADDATARVCVESVGNADIGEEFAVRVNSSEITAAGGEFTLEYNDSILDLVSLKVNDKFKQKGTICEVRENGQAENSICFYFFNSSDINYEGTFAEFEFKAVSEGDAEFKLSNVSISDYELNDLDIDVQNTKLTVAEKKTAMPTAEIPSKETTYTASGGDSETVSESTAEAASEVPAESSYNIDKAEPEENFAAENSKIYGCNGSSEFLIIPAEINGEPVKKIAKDFLVQNTEVKYVVLPDTIEEITPEAFKNVYIFCNYKSRTAETLSRANINFTFIGDVDEKDGVNEADMDKVMYFVRNSEDYENQFSEKGEQSAKLASTNGNITATTAAKIFSIAKK